MRSRQNWLRLSFEICLYKIQQIELKLKWKSLCLGSKLLRLQAAGGLDPLLTLLSSGQEMLHDSLPCVAEYVEQKTTGPKIKSVEGMCCFDPSHGHLCLAPKDMQTFSCFGPSSDLDPK